MAYIATKPVSLPVASLGVAIANNYITSN